jgi:hypothetical protein
MFTVLQFQQLMESEMFLSTLVLKLKEKKFMFFGLVFAKNRYC